MIEIEAFQVARGHLETGLLPRIRGRLALARGRNGRACGEKALAARVRRRPPRPDRASRSATDPRSRPSPKLR
jgi:hypothetical protein